MTPFRIIGLTGPSGAGKSTVAMLFTEHGIPVIDADRVYHELLIPPSPCLDALSEAFTPAILSPDGSLDRAVLAALVFEDSDAGRERLAQLNRITHRFVIERTNELLAQYREQNLAAAVIDAPLLIEADMHRMCDLTVCVLADRQTRLTRLMARDHKDETAILARIEAQPDDDFYLSNTDMAIYTDSQTTVQQLQRKVRDVLLRAKVEL